MLRRFSYVKAAETFIMSSLGGFVLVLGWYLPTELALLLLWFMLMCLVVLRNLFAVVFLAVLSFY